MENKIFDCSYISNAKNATFRTAESRILRHYSDSNIVIADRLITTPLQFLHTHNFFEFDIILSGIGLNEAPDGQTEIRRGSLIFQSPATMHRFINIGSEPLRILNIEFSGECEQVLLSQPGALNAMILQLSENILDAVITEADSILNGINPENELFAKGAAYKIISLVQSQYRQQHLDFILIKPERTVQEALLYLHRNYAKKLSIKDVAEHVNFSPDYLSKLIKKRTGRSFKQYLLRVRMENAYRLLAEGGKTVKSVCTEVGYSSYTNFHYAFMKVFGIHPGKLLTSPQNELFSHYNRF